MPEEGGGVNNSSRGRANYYCFSVYKVFIQYYQSYLLYQSLKELKIYKTGSYSNLVFNQYTVGALVQDSVE